MTDSSISPTRAIRRRALPKLMLGGVWRKLLWSTTLWLPDSPGSRHRRAKRLRIEPGRTASEIQLGLSAAYYDEDRRFAVGPEAILATSATGGLFFALWHQLELLLAGHYNIAHMVQAGLALGAGFVRQPGTPDFRALFRLAYAPMVDRKHDRDGDGIPMPTMPRT